MIDMDLPGAEIVAIGLEDLRARRITAESLALEVIAQRLRPLGIAIDSSTDDAELALYAFLRDNGHSDAYGRYNSLLRRLDSFSAALEQRQRLARVR